MAFPHCFGQICSEFPWHYCVFSGLKIAYMWSNAMSNTAPVCIKFWQHWVSLPKQQGVRHFAEICTDYCNLPAFANKYICKLAFWRQNTVRSLIVSSAQVICVHQMSPPKLFVHQRSSKLVNAEWLTLAIHTTDVYLPEIAWSNIFD